MSQKKPWNMHKQKISAALLGLVLFSLLAGSTLTGCGKQASSSKQENHLVLAQSSDTGGMDPAGNIALTYLSYASNALDELLTYNQKGEIEYRAAVSYQVNEENTLWTFHLRKEAVWSDGTPVRAADFVNTMTRALDPKSGNGYANYLFVIQNAQDIYYGKAQPEELGVETPDDYTLVFHLTKPCVYFLDLLRLPVYMPSCTTYAKATDGWDADPDTSVSNGPFYLAEYVPEQYYVLKKNTRYWNADQVHLDQITCRFFDSQEAMANAYESHQADGASGLQSTVIDLYRGKKDLVVTDSIATRYIYFNLNVKPLDDVRVRKAINLALNRKDLCTMVGGDTEPTVNLVAKYMTDRNTGEYFTEEAAPPFEENLAEAKKLLAEAGYPDGKGFPVLTYKYPTLETDSDTAQVIQEQLKKNLNIEIRLQAEELQVNYSDRKAGNFDLCRMNWTADFADPYTYLSMLLSGSTYNCSGIRDAKYDALVEQSDSETDPQKRNSLLHQAEQLAVGEEFYILPLYSVKNVSLINPELKGITRNPATGGLEYRYAKWESK